MSDILKAKILANVDEYQFLSDNIFLKLLLNIENVTFLGHFFNSNFHYDRGCDRHVTWISS